MATAPAAKPLNFALMTAQEVHYLKKLPHYDNVIIDSRELRRRIRLDYPQEWTGSKSPYVGLGDLDKFPREIQFHIFAATAISDLIHLRATNTSTKHVLQQWEPFRLIMTHGADAVRALLATHSGHWWTAPQLVDALFTTACEFCNEHGEILQLLRLKRCCFRCLSQERDLLAINYEYAHVFLKLSHEELQRLPCLYPIHQKSFWGLPSRRGAVYDYQTALDTIRRRGECQSLISGKTDRNRPELMRVIGKGVPLSSTGDFLGPEWRSIQPRTQEPLQARRRQLPLLLPVYEVNPPETVYVQHGCAVRAAALTRTIKQPVNGRVQSSISKIEAVHCAGCAFYWNYHSPLPVQFHRLFPHNSNHRDYSTVETAFTRHVTKCIYARLRWTMLYCPWDPLPLHKIIHILDTYQRAHLQRQGRTSVRASNRDFEMIPIRAEIVLEAHADNSEAFQPRYEWPVLRKGDDENVQEEAYGFKYEDALVRLRRRTHLEPSIDRHDHYWDALVSQEAISQSHWACANPENGQMSLFRGPLSLMLEQKTIKQRKAPNMQSQSSSVWGFDRF